MPDAFPTRNVKFDPFKFAPNNGNEMVVRRQVARSRQQSGGAPNPRQLGALGEMGDYLTDLRYRQFTTRGNAEGPVNAPVIPADGPNTIEDMLWDIRALLERMPLMFSNEFRTKFIMPPRESISFTAGTVGAEVSVAAGAAVAVVSEAIEERFTGFLTHVGVNVITPGSFPDITWQIRINGNIHPKFTNRIFDSNSLSTPLPFNFELTQSRTLQLVAINTSGVPVVVSGLLVGWLEFMMTNKSYGSSPQSGVA